MAKYDLTAQQLKVYRAFQEMWMAWISLVVVLGLTIGAFVVFSVIALSKANLVNSGISGSITLVLGWALNPVFKYLFPAKGR
jgi:hypothetical protein